jgi:hypothetical protein
MAQKRYGFLVKYKDEPGAGFGKQYITADNPHAAASIAESLYGRLLMTKSAIETLD